MTTLYIAPYKLANTASKDLARNLNCLRIKPIDSNYCPKSHHKIINWGRSYCPFPVHANQPWAVSWAVNKLKTLDALSWNNIPCLKFGNFFQAQLWLLAGHIVYARTKLSSYGGHGIKILRSTEDLNELQNCSLFTKQFPTHREYRVHVAFGKALIVLQKKKKRGTDPDPLIRSHLNNWVFCQYNLTPYPETLTETAIKAVQTLGLDFGGVDIALDRNNNPCVFEINTAPGLEGTSLIKYTEAFKEHFNA